ncbi:uncharacterized protein [Arachis hypogaea]|uniref:uncharacterized protein n=1 Tax=Arachis hypogaea TaxID=3818 RepID=UPI0007AEFB26
MEESPFQLAYGIEAMMPIEVNKESLRVRFYDEVGNIRAQTEELDILPEVREQARIKEEALKQRMALRYNKKAIKRSFATNDLPLIRNDIGTQKSSERKLAANWKGSYKITKFLEKDYYKVSDLKGNELPRVFLKGDFNEAP